MVRRKKKRSHTAGKTQLAMFFEPNVTGHAGWLRQVVVVLPGDVKSQFDDAE